MGRPPRPDCNACGIIKTIENTGTFVQKNGSVSFRSYCKSCASNRECINPNETGYYEYVVYVFKDTGGTVTYVGSTGNYHKRMLNHRTQGTIHPNEVAYIIETTETLTKEEGTAWAKIQEDRYMAVHTDTIRNKIASGVCVRSRIVHG